MNDRAEVSWAGIRRVHLRDGGEGRRHVQEREAVGKMARKRVKERVQQLLSPLPTEGIGRKGYTIDG